MSTGFECAFFKVSKQQSFDYGSGVQKALQPGWYYMLQNWTCPVGVAWYSDATPYGPFDTKETAEEHLSDTQPNPGGWATHEDPSEDFLRAAAFNKS